LIYTHGIGTVARRHAGAHDGPFGCETVYAGDTSWVRVPPVVVIVNWTRPGVKSAKKTAFVQPFAPGQVAV
jgi:hypothetical protein